MKTVTINTTKKDIKKASKEFRKQRKNPQKKRWQECAIS